MIRRRELLAVMAGLMPFGQLQAAAGRIARSRHLVLIELKGGNDALNAFPPYRDPLYAKLRPRLALPQSAVLAVTPTIGLHAALAPLKAAWDTGEMSLVQGVGYADPVLSHFESARIWETGSRAPDAETGWLSPMVMGAPSALDPVAAVFGFNAGPLRGSEKRTVQLLGLDGLDRPIEVDNTDVVYDTPAMRQLLAVRQQQATLRRYARVMSAMPPLSEGLKAQLLSQSLRCVAAMLTQPLAPIVYKLVIGGFDTHAGQLEAQARQLAKFAAAISDFRRLLLQLGLWERVLVVAYSEFGRRVGENASGGTDHGAAQTMMLIGQSVQPGVLGTPYDLAALDEAGNLPAQVDFREVFNAIGRDWLPHGLFFPERPAQTQLFRV